jgi:ATP-dependent RNA helicase DeaD
MKNTTMFSGLELDTRIANALADMDFETLTPIQNQCIPLILSGKDVVGQAQTGTGKTAAFGIPAISLLDESDRKTQILIQCPTRELAIQVTSELIKIGKYFDKLQVVPVYGGQPIPRQLSALKRGAQIVVGTPGRTIDHLKRGTLNLKSLKMIIFDEADEMLNMGFREDMEEILTYSTGKVQKVMFSATVPGPIREIMNRYMQDPANVRTDRKAIAAPDIKQYVVEIRDSVRTEAISRFMDVRGFKLGMVFCNTKRQTESVATELKARGLATALINGDLSQAQRDNVMKKFRAGEIDLLVATDVAARGIDVPDVDVIFNFEIPQDPEYYVHRIGRTGRAGKHGSSITFSAGRKNRRLSFIEKQVGVRLEPLSMPSIKDVRESRMASQITELESVLQKGGLKPYIEQIEVMAAGDYTTVEIAAALLKLRTAAQEEFEPEIEKQKSAPKSAAKRYNDGDMVRINFNLGRKSKVSPGDIVGAIAGETGIPGNSIGEINIQSNYSFADVPAEYADKVLSIMNKAKIKGKRVRVKAD